MLNAQVHQNMQLAQRSKQPPNAIDVLLPSAISFRLTALAPPATSARSVKTAGRNLIVISDCLVAKPANAKGKNPKRRRVATAGSSQRLICGPGNTAGSVFERRSPCTLARRGLPSFVNALGWAQHGDPPAKNAAGDKQLSPMLLNALTLIQDQIWKQHQNPGTFLLHYHNFAPTGPCRPSRVDQRQMLCLLAGRVSEGHAPQEVAVDPNSQLAVWPIQRHAAANPTAVLLFVHAHHQRGSRAHAPLQVEALWAG